MLQGRHVRKEPTCFSRGKRAVSFKKFPVAGSAADGTIFATPNNIVSETNTESNENMNNQNSSENTMSGYSSTNGYGTPIIGII